MRVQLRTIEFSLAFLTRPVQIMSELATSSVSNQKLSFRIKRTQESSTMPALVSKRKLPPLGAQRRTKRNARFAQSPRYSHSNLYRAGSIAVDANGLRINPDLAAAPGNPSPPPSDPPPPPPRL